MALSTSQISYYKLEGNSTDSVGANNGTDTAITYSNANGKIGQGAGFDGSTSNIIIGTGFNTALISNAWSINFWANPTILNTLAFFIANDNSTGARQFAFGFGADSGGAPDTQQKLYFERAGVPILFDSGTALTATYQMITATYDGINLRTYINSALNTTTAMTALPTSANSVYVGERQFTGAQRRYTGTIDELGIWSKVLTASEITNLYNNAVALQYPYSGMSGSNLLMMM